MHIRMDLTALLQEKIKQLVVAEYGISDISFIVEHPENESFGDYATNVALVLSKVLKQAPMVIAKELCYKIQQPAKINDKNSFLDIFITAEAVAPGFINFKINHFWLLNLLTSFLQPATNYGITHVLPDGVNKRIALEHSNVNPNKAAHIGHLRNACIGQFIERAYEKLGYDVEVQYYANNAGVQVATSMMGVQKITDLSPTSYDKYDHYAWDVYSRMESLVASDPQLQQERLEILKKLDDPTSKESIQQREIANKILAEQLKTFSSLGIDYDVIVYETDILARKFWEKAFALLKENANVYYAKQGPSAGCWLVKLGEKGQSDNENTQDIEADKIIVRSNGVPTYTGKDIAYHMWKFGLLGEDFLYQKWPQNTQNKPLWTTTPEVPTASQQISFSGVEKVFDVVGVEQTYAMDVVKKALSYLGYSAQSQNMLHINYGFVFVSRETASQLGIDVSDGKKFYAMSGRKGWGIKIDDLIKKVDAKLRSVYGDISVETVRTGAIKFQMLKLNTFQDLIFDLDDALDIKGFSGPYVQYAFVRANNIINKSKEDFHNISLDLSVLGDLDPKELALLRTIYRYSEVVKKSAAEFAPNVLCDYLFELSKKFNSFYNDIQILMAENAHSRKFRLALTYVTRGILQDGLFLLGIDSPSRM